jgi:DNA polymerase V
MNKNPTYEPLEGTSVSVHTGFPNAADDARLQPLNLNTLLTPNPYSTYHFRVAGDQWQKIGIFNNDIALIDRALKPQPQDVVVWLCESEFALSTYKHIPKQAEVWGVVSATIHQLRGGHRI